MSVAPVPSRLDLLPTELFVPIIHHIGLDLTSHVFFSKLNPRLIACYEELDDMFWQRNLRASGLGLLSGETLSTPGQWKQLAFECAEHGGSCQHPICGWTRLWRNEYLMAEALSDNDHDLMYTLTKNSTTFEEQHPLPLSDFFPLSDPGTWGHFAFKTTWVHNTRVARAHLRGEDGTFGDPVASHPVLWRTFATFSPVDVMAMNDMDNMCDPANHDGVKVGDFLTSVAACLHAPVDLSQLTNLVRFVKPKNIFPSTWRWDEMFKALRNMDDWFKLTRWRGIDYDGTEEHRGFVYGWSFVGNELPEHYDDYSRSVLC